MTSEARFTWDGTDRRTHLKVTGGSYQSRSHLQVLDKNPLSGIRNTNTVRFVMVNGRLYDANTMDEVWPRRRKFTRAWWKEK